MEEKASAWLCWPCACSQVSPKAATLGAPHAGALHWLCLGLQPALAFLLCLFCPRNAYSTFAEAFLAFVPASIISVTLEDVKLSCKRGQTCFVLLRVDDSYQNVFFNGWIRSLPRTLGEMAGILNLHISGSLTWQETKQGVTLSSFSVCRDREAFALP